ncbi:MAG: hypothetical protein RBT62_11540 [Spirochaetia bacterium]|jgi:hypothetical protein|nr:hypothetical protein [Spirochaetia bacterium]
MRVLSIQLPRQDPSGDGARDNVPYMAARMMAYAESRGAIKREQWAFLDDDTADYGGDAAILAACIQASPDLLILQLSDWNMERSIWLAKRLRLLLPATHFAAFGPEIAPGMPALKAQAFDTVIEGEPEIPFVELLSDLDSRSLRPHYVASSPLNMQEAPDPYLCGALVIKPDKPVLIENARGSSSIPAFLRGDPGPLRYAGKDVAARLLRLASEQGADEARFIDMKLDDQADFKAFIKSLAAANETGVAVLANLDPVAIDDEAAKLLNDASFLAVWACLGSIKPEALDAVGLKLDKDGFERGSKLLWSRGIMVKPELYLGLPHDDYASTIESFDFLGMVGMGQDTDLLPLTVSPGSAMRSDSASYGIKEYLERPPYWVVETEWMDEDDFLDAVADFEENFDVSWKAPVAPYFSSQRGGFTSFADLRSKASLDALLLSPERLASSLTLLLDADDQENLARVARAAKDIRKENPYCLWQIVLYSDLGIPAVNEAQRLADAFFMPEHYFELSRLYSLDPQPEFQTRLFFATSSEALALVALRDRQDLETLFSIGNEMPGDRLLEAMPFLALDREGSSFELLYDAMSAYRDYPDLLVEAPRSLFRKS